MSNGLFLIAHPKGNLIWDTGAIPDNSWTPTAVLSRCMSHSRTARREKRTWTIPASASSRKRYSHSEHQLPCPFALHYDHIANANAFPSATWLVRQVERDAMFGWKDLRLAQPSTFSALQKSKTIILKNMKRRVR